MDASVVVPWKVLLSLLVTHSLSPHYFQNYNHTQAQHAQEGKTLIVIHETVIYTKILRGDCKSKGAHISQFGCSCLVSRSCLTLRTVTHQAPLSMRFPRQEYDGSGLPFPSPGIFPTQGFNSCILHLQADSLPLNLIDIAKLPSTEIY